MLREARDRARRIKHSQRLLALEVSLGEFGSRFRRQVATPAMWDRRDPPLPVFKQAVGG